MDHLNQHNFSKALKREDRRPMVKEESGRVRKVEGKRDVLSAQLKQH